MTTRCINVALNRGIHPLRRCLPRPHSVGAATAGGPHAVSAAARLCSTAPPGEGGPTIAPKKPKRRIEARLDASALLKNVPSEPGAYGELSTASLERKVEEWARLHPSQLEELVAKFEAREEESSRVLVEDSVHQMDISLKPRASSAVRVFWKSVDVAALEEYPGWYTVTVDGRKVKAFESTCVLAVPSEALAYCCAVEYGEQEGHLNKLLMPITDVCSGALHIAPQMLLPRIDYLMSFFQNDNLYFRSSTIVHQQDEAIQPIANWFEAKYGVKVPRIVGIGHPQITPEDCKLVRDALVAMHLNPYQVLALCVTAQFTSSLLLPLALFSGVVDLETAIRINRAEEAHNADTIAPIKGYHDIREADVVTKIAACATVWRLTRAVTLAKALEVPRVRTLDDVDSA
eukprot:gene12529-8583_t